MTRAEQRALLVAWEDWRVTRTDRAKTRDGNIVAFLEHGPLGPIRCCECGGTEHEPRGLCSGVLHPSGADEERGKSQRFWTVSDHGGGGFWAVMINKARQYVGSVSIRPWNTREEAEADGRASGLEEWRP